MIIIIRHGQTIWNILKKKQGHKNSKLTDKGKEQGHKVAKFLNKKFSTNINFIVYASPIKRVKDYIKIIDKDLKYFRLANKINYFNSLKEHKFGKWEGKTIKEIRMKYKDEYQSREKDKWNYKIPNGESYKLLSIKLKNFIKKKINYKKNYIIFTHEMVSKVLRGNLMNFSKKEIIKSKHNSNYIYVFENKKLQKYKI
tara:strand:+ start:45057 stop:45650 length:594 start_codon:yes stop_codon:yes gene_type:complete